MSIIASYLVLVELGNSDGSKYADDRNYNQQFYECDSGRQWDYVMTFGRDRQGAELWRY